MAAIQHSVGLPVDSAFSKLKCTVSNTKCAAARTISALFWLGRHRPSSTAMYAFVSHTLVPQCVCICNLAKLLSITCVVCHSRCRNIQLRVKFVASSVFKLCAHLHYSGGVSRKTQPISFCDLRSARTRVPSNVLEGVCETDTSNVVMGEPAFISSKNPILRPDSRPASVEAPDSPVTNRARLQQADNIALFTCGFHSLGRPVLTDPIGSITSALAYVM